MRRRAALGALLLAAPAYAQRPRWPSGPVRVIVPWTPGGAADTLGRWAAGVLNQAFGMPFVVENRPGAGGNIGVELAARAAPDGQTLGVVAAAAAVNATLYRNLTFDLLRDLAPITLLGLVPNVLVVHPDVAVQDAAGFAVYARAQRGGVTYGSAGIGTLPHLSMAMLLQRVGAEGVHVPFRGSQPAVTELLAGRIPTLFENLPPLAPHIRDGRVRALAISTAERHPDFPDLPTAAEAVPLPGFEATAWQSLMAPAGTPAEIVEAIGAAIRTALGTAEGVAPVKAVGALPRPLTPREFSAFVAAEVGRWGEAVRSAGVTVE